MPMIGFTWPLFPVFKVNGLSFGRRGGISGGVREYRGTLSTRSIDSYTRQTGLPSAIQQLYCIGAAAPPPDWEGYQHGESIPTDCANGAASTPLAQTTPPVALFAPNYTLYDSWRPAFNVNYTLNTQFRVSANATWAINRNVPGNYDLNFNPAARFSLASEGNRPIYVSPTSIVPATGAETFADSRVSSDFAHVNEARSDLRSQVRTFGGTLNYSPFQIFFTGPNSAFWFASVSYSYNDAREQYRGFQSTAGDPREISWSRGIQAKHVVTFTYNRSQGNLGSHRAARRACSRARRSRRPSWATSTATATQTTARSSSLRLRQTPRPRAWRSFSETRRRGREAVSRNRSAPSPAGTAASARGRSRSST